MPKSSASCRKIRCSSAPKSTRSARGRSAAVGPGPRRRRRRAGDARSHVERHRVRDARRRATTRRTSPTSPITAAAATATGAAATRGDDDDFLPQQVATSTLRDHLNGQLALLNLPLRDRHIVTALIDALDDDGYLPTPLEEIAELFPAELEIEPEELSIALKYVQSFEPAGVGARDCAECLALQLKTLPADTPFRADALKVVDGHLPLLANRDFTKLKRLLHTDDAGVRGVRDLIRSLNPRPGARVREGRGELRHPGRGRTQDPRTNGSRR